MDLKQILKTIKMNESRISTVAGGIIIVVIGIMVFNYFRNLSGTLTPGVSTENNPSESVYTVQKGDTLWSIAENQLGDGFRWTEIRDGNGLDSDQIEVGQELSLPTSDIAEVVTPTPEVTISVSPSPIASASPSSEIVMEDHTENQISADSYTVVRGDNLWTIAERAYGDGYKWVEIAKANKLVNPNIIHSGNVLTLPR